MGFLLGLCHTQIDRKKKKSFETIAFSGSGQKRKPDIPEI
jgi:hypothetical protein